MGWSCMHCTFLNPCDSAATCKACSAIRVLQCPTCKNEIKYGKRLHVDGKTYHPDCFCCTGCQKPLPGPFQVVKGGNYHSECAPKPRVINKTITTIIQPLSESSLKPVKSEKCYENHDNLKAKSGGGAAPKMGWACSTCTFYNANEATVICEACNAIRIVQCPGCKGEIKYGPRTNVQGKSYHPDCFRCAACHQKFSTNKFQVKDGEFYDHECYKELFHPRCDVCANFIPYQAGTQNIAFKVMPFWNLNYCAEHDNCDRCCSCQRVEPIAPERHFHQLSDKRKVCHDCCKYIVLDTNEAQGVVKEVWAYMKDIGINLPEIPVYLVESSVLNEHKKANVSKIVNKPVKCPVTRGLCISEVSQIQHMVRTGKQAISRVASIETTRSVSAILILHGLPYDLTTSILAHEATHAYIKLSDNFPDSIPPKIEEGICQLMSYLFLKYKHVIERKESKTRAYENRLRKFYMQQLKHDLSAIYGDGFREAYKAYKRVNSLQQMFDAIRHHASFP
uniref:LIM zinc-binding domain-containing protein n=1 Tax=Peronospora matthiolae TaxID=2874970 RepID=A0AAV1TWQ4_9STRA